MSEEYSLKFHLHNTFDVFICGKFRFSEKVSVLFQNWSLKLTYIP